MFPDESGENRFKRGEMQVETNDHAERSRICDRIPPTFHKTEWEQAIRDSIPLVMRVEIHARQINSKNILQCFYNVCLWHLLFLYKVN